MYIYKCSKTGKKQKQNNSKINFQFLHVSIYNTHVYVIGSDSFIQIRMGKINAIQKAASDRQWVVDVVVLPQCTK
jgi:hypothetical protein